MGKNQLFFVVIFELLLDIKFTKIEKYFLISDKIPSSYNICMTVHITNIVVCMFFFFFAFAKFRGISLKNNILKTSLQIKS